MTVTEPTSLAESLRKEVETLHALRTTLAAQQLVVKTRMDALKASMAGELAAIEATKKAVEEAEDTVRSLALVVHETTENKKPVPGVEVKIGTVYQYDEAKAWEWAQKTGLCVIPAKLDVDALIDVAKATPLPFVTETEQPKAFIAKDLSKAVSLGPDL